MGNSVKPNAKWFMLNVFWGRVQGSLYNVRLIPHSLSVSFPPKCVFWAINFDRGDTEKWQRRRSRKERTDGRTDGRRNGRKCMNRNELRDREKLRGSSRYCTFPTRRLLLVVTEDWRGLAQNYSRKCSKGSQSPPVSLSFGYSYRM